MVREQVGFQALLWYVNLPCYTVLPFQQSLQSKVWRSPVRLPTDCQKLEAVDHPELRHLEDVVIFSTQGKRSKMSLLAGGDFDGDMVEVTWHPDIVGSFNNAPLEFADPPAGFDALLEDAGPKFKQEADRLQLRDTIGQWEALKSHLFNGCTIDYHVGQFSHVADILTYVKGTCYRIIVAKLQANYLQRP
jgi:hypothetical protein